MFVEFGAGDEVAAMESEVFENGIVASGHDDGFAGFGHGFGAGVDLNVAEVDAGIGFAGGTADERTEAGEEFGEIERFDEVIVGAGVEAADAVFGGVAGSEHEDGSLFGFA